MRCYGHRRGSVVTFSSTVKSLERAATFCRATDTTSALGWPGMFYVGANVLAAFVLTAAPPPSIMPCAGELNCISSNGRESPNQFAAPLSYAPRIRDEAYRAASSLLEKRCRDVEASGFGISATCSGNRLKLLVRDDGIVVFRASAIVKTAPPPWCLTKGCINGAMPQRELVSDLASSLSWSPIDATNILDDGKWTPIFLNTDAVPRTDDDE